MICEICGKTVEKEDSYRTKDKKYICKSCSTRYPKSVVNDIGSFTYSQLRDGVEKISCRFRGNDPYVSRGNVGFRKNGIIVNGYSFWLHSLKSVEAEFHPRVKVGEGLAKGWLTIKLVTNAPAIEFREVICDEMITLEYRLESGAPEFFIDWALLNALDEFNDMIERGVRDASGFLTKLAETGYWECHGIARPAPERPVTDLEREMKRFGLTVPYTEEDVDRAWKALIKREKLHPDEGGTDKAFIDSEKARDLLKTMATGGIG